MNDAIYPNEEQFFSCESLQINERYRVEKLAAVFQFVS